MLFTEALEEYWLEKTRNFSRHTVNDYKGTFAKFIRFMGGDFHVETATTKDVRKFLNELVYKEQLAPHTVCNSWTALSSFWTWAEIDLAAPHIIRGRVKMPKIPKRFIEPYTRAEIKALLKCAMTFEWITRNGKTATSPRPTGLRDVAIMVTLLDTGIRSSELLDSKVADYRKSDGRLTIHHGKGNKKREVYLGKAARRVVWEYLCTRPGRNDQDALFATSTNQHIERMALLHMIKRTAIRAGVAKANVHKFRHTFAINFLRNNGNLLELQALLGHEHLETVSIYATMASMDLERAQRRASPADNWGL